MSSLNYWLWLANRTGLTARMANRLLRDFGSPERLFFADEAEMNAAGVPVRTQQLLQKRSLVESRQIIERCRGLGQQILTMDDAQYPARLQNISDPPLVLYVRGSLPDLDNEAVVAVVGTRSCSEYGTRAARRIAGEYAARGGVIVTGLAKGIDTAAAEGALANGGLVIGVTGGGADVIYPAENRSLFEAVEKHGAIISEYPPGTSCDAWRFPVRNRIMSGLSLGVLVVEAPHRSGASITAGQALEQGRDVFVVPGPIDQASCVGSNRLLKEGAMPVTCGADLVAEYAAMYPDKLNADPKARPVPERSIDKRPVQRYTSSETAPKAPKAPEPPRFPVMEAEGDERAVLLAIRGENTPVDEIIAGSGLGAAATLAVLTMLEIQGAVKRGEGKRYTRTVTVREEA